MRSVLFVAASGFMISVSANAQRASTPPPAPNPGLACFENLSMPEYPKAALQAHIDGSVWTTTQVSAQGTIDKIDTQVVSAWHDGPKLLTPPVEKAIRSAQIKSECDGKAVSVVFRYELHGTAEQNPKVTSRTEAPNIMYIESQPESQNATSASSRIPVK
jgi:Gram-negative bacterial TonB protein C-terminal